MLRPAEILKAIQVVNAAKRRGQSAPEHINNQQTIVNITLPTSIATKFVTNVKNQVVEAGEQQLLTMPSSQLLTIANKGEQDEDFSPASQLSTESL